MVRGGERIALVLDIELKKKMHVYAPGVEGYIPIDFTVDGAAGMVHDAVYPKSKKLRLKAIKETALVYDKPFRLVREITIAPDGKLKPLLSTEGELVIKGSLRYQACDDKVCYIPETIPLEWKVTVEGHDRQRAPKEMQRKSN
ncbi:MAG: protein-disulfide reductase DsbD domain-containing protein [Bryobacteraceae bacterium]